MSSRVVLALATLVVAAVAFPSNTFVRLDQYVYDANCTASAAGALTSSSYYPLDFCIASTSGGTARADKYVFDNSMNNVAIWRYTNAQCTGTPTLNGNYSVGVCGYTSGVLTQANRKATVLASSVGMISTTFYSTHGCGSDVRSMNFFMQGCRSSEGTVYTVGGKLEICHPADGARSNADCSGNLECDSANRDCNDITGDDGSDQGSVQYDWNAANAATPAVALTAALIAFVAAATKF